MSRGKLETIYGLHTVRLALDNTPENILEVNVQKDRKPSAELQEVITRIKDIGITVQEISRESLDKQSGFSRHQGILVKLKTRGRHNQDELDTLLSREGKSLLFLVLDGVQDPHNLGACLRSANAAAVDAVLVSRDRSAQLNATVSKVASGGAEHTRIIQVSNIARSLRKLRNAGVWIVGTAADVDDNLYGIDLCSSVAIVMGSEGKGLRQNTRQHCDHLVKLPMYGVVESLNVSVAAGICLYEVLRQRGIAEITPAGAIRPGP